MDFNIAFILSLPETSESIASNLPSKDLVNFSIAVQPLFKEGALRLKNMLLSKLVKLNSSEALNYEDWKILGIDFLAAYLGRAQTIELSAFFCKHEYVNNDWYNENIMTVHIGHVYHRDFLVSALKTVFENEALRTSLVAAKLQSKAADGEIHTWDHGLIQLLSLLGFPDLTLILSFHDSFAVRPLGMVWEAFWSLCIVLLGRKYDLSSFDLKKTCTVVASNMHFSKALAELQYSIVEWVDVLLSQQYFRSGNNIFDITAALEAVSKRAVKDIVESMILVKEQEVVEWLKIQISNSQWVRLIYEIVSSPYSIMKSNATRMIATILSSIDEALDTHKGSFSESVLKCVAYEIVEGLAGRFRDGVWVSAYLSAVLTTSRGNKFVFDNDQALTFVTETLEPHVNHRNKLHLSDVVFDTRKRDDARIINTVLNHLFLPIASRQHFLFIRACEKGDEGLVITFLADKIIKPSFRQNEALLVASIRGHTSIVTLILTRLSGMPISNLSDIIGSATDPEVLKILLSHPDADFDKIIDRDKELGWDIIRILLEQPDFDLLEHQDRIFAKAVDESCLDVVKTLMEGEKVDLKESEAVKLLKRAIVKAVSLSVTANKNELEHTHHADLRSAAIDVVRIFLDDRRITGFSFTEVDITDSSGKIDNELCNIVLSHPRNQSGEVAV